MATVPLMPGSSKCWTQQERMVGRGVLLVGGSLSLMLDVIISRTSPFSLPIKVSHFRIIVWLTEGRSCICSAQFCYLCAATWKTCPCPQWNENRLLRRAEEVVAREGVVGQRELDHVRADIARQLMDHHHCDPPHWQYIAGPHHCDLCRRIMRRWIFRCHLCYLEVCARCRRNRL